MTEPEGSSAGLFIVDHEELIAQDDLGMIVKLSDRLWTWMHMRLLARA